MSAAEFARPVPLTRLTRGPLRQRIAASEAERAALAQRFALVSLDRLEAEVELAREPRGTILLSAAFEAEFAQQCVVTLEPVAGSASERFQVRYGPPEAEADAPDGDDDPPFEPLSGGTIDLGEAVAQEFSLALPPFPRAPGAVIEADSFEASDESPFAELARLSRREPQ